MKLLKVDYKDFLGGLKKEIIAARQKVYQTVNQHLFELYWSIGKGIFEKVELSQWGDGVIETLAKDLQRAFPDMRGFSAQNLWRMKQMYDVYKSSEKLSTLLRELSWSHNVLILSRADTLEEKEFYLKTCVHERWSFRELERQIDSSLFERFMLSKKTDKLIPNPSVGLILCKSKNDEVVRMAVSKLASAMKVAAYKTKLIDQKLLKAKLHSLPALEDFRNSYQ